MASPLKIKRLSREDFKDAPPWIDRLLVWLNQFVEYVALSFNKEITFDDNIQAQIKSFEVLAGATPALCTAQFTSTLRVVPRGVIKIKATQRSGNYVILSSSIDIFWRYESGTIFITSVTGLTAGNTYDFTVLVI